MGLISRVSSRTYREKASTMGIIFSAASMACCFGSAACTICSCCPGQTTSTMARVGYAVLVIIGLALQLISLNQTVATWIIKTGVYKCPSQGGAGGGGGGGKDGFDLSSAIDQGKQFVDKVTGLATGETDALSLIGQEATPECYYNASYFFLYRVSFAYLLFFGAFSLLMIKVKTSNDMRSGLQNGYWGVKFIAIISLIIACFFIPQGGFDSFLYVIGCMCGGFFLLWQLLILIDFAHAWNEGLLGRLEASDGGEGCAKFSLIFFSLGQLILSLVGIILLYVYFGGSDCSLNNFFITMALILCIICAIFSMLPSVQEAQPTSGLLQAAVVGLYIVYLTFSAVSNEQDESYKQCNPFYTTMKSDTNVAATKLMNGSSILGTILFVVVVLYSTIRGSDGGDSSETQSLTGRGVEMTLIDGQDKSRPTGDREKGTVEDDEGE